ncbi:MAG TPA: 16S rRNA (cytosine(967)-C(5))-methyltransferase RsmB [Terriglobia bacterium]|nr:16S rRNA (cytosine(967)-C(5))-methyltransferase RsmB [Terriglobia bacterium]
MSVRFFLHNSLLLIHNLSVPISPAREAAYRILCRVESGRDYAVDLLQSPQISSLKEMDRRLVTEIVMGTLRRRGEIEHWLIKLSGKKLSYFDHEIATILRLSLYQILFLERIPKSAVVNEAVELAKAARKRSATGVVNAVLRKAEPLHERAQAETRTDPPSSPDAARSGGAAHSLPAWLQERWSRHFGHEAMESLARASLRVPPTTLRVAGGARERTKIQEQLNEQGIVTQPGRYSAQALVVQSVESGNVQSSPVIRERRVVIQDEASQLVASLVAPKPGERVLDLCAAPGIKAGQLADALGAGLMIACDLSARRLDTLRRLLPKMIPADLNVHLVRLDAARALPFGIAFHRILLDAPCSGTGTLARNPEIKWRLEPKDLPRLADLQVRILQNALTAIEPGGRAVYSTCSLEPEENEQVIERVLHAINGFRLLPASELSREFPSLSPLFNFQGFFHTRPDLHGMDGFFAAVIQRE